MSGCSGGPVLVLDQPPHSSGWLSDVQDGHTNFDIAIGVVSCDQAARLSSEMNGIGAVRLTEVLEWIMNTTGKVGGMKQARRAT